MIKITLADRVQVNSCAGWCKVLAMVVGNIYESVSPGTVAARFTKGERDETPDVRIDLGSAVGSDGILCPQGGAVSPHRRDNSNLGVDFVYTTS